VTGGEVYGRDAELRSFLEDHGTGDVLKIPCSFRITLPSGQRIAAARVLGKLLTERWCRLSE